MDAVDRSLPVPNRPMEARSYREALMDEPIEDSGPIGAPQPQVREIDLVDDELVCDSVPPMNQEPWPRGRGGL